MDNLFSFFSKNLSKNQLILSALILSFLFAYPILSANVYYEDDLFRIFTGQYVWEMLGRIFTYYLMHIVTFSFGSMLNVTPLPLILSCLVLAFAINYTATKLLNSSTLLSILLAFCLVCNPYMLANLSYAYDSLHMALAFFLAIIAFVKVRENKISSILYLLSTFLLYQPMGNVFLGLIFFSVIVDVANNVNFKTTILSLLKKIAIFALSLLLCLALLKLFYFFTSHKMQRSEMLSIYSFLFDGIFIQRIIAIYDYVSLLYKNAEGFFIVCLLSVIFAVFTLSQRNIVKYILILLAAIGLYLSLFGPMFLLKEGLIKARVLPTLGVIIFTLLYVSFLFYKKYENKFIRLISLFSIVVTAWYLITLSFGYGNYLYDQRKYDEHVALLIQQDVLSLNNLAKKTVYFEGCPNKPRSVALLERFRPFYTQLHTPACVWRSKFMLYNDILGQFKFDYKWGWYYPEIKNKICQNKLQAVFDKNIYKVYEGDNFVFVDLGNKLVCK